MMGKIVGWNDLDADRNELTPWLDEDEEEPRTSVDADRHSEADGDLDDSTSYEIEDEDCDVLDDDESEDSDNSLRSDAERAIARVVQESVLVDAEASSSEDESLSLTAQICQAIAELPITKEEKSAWDLDAADITSSSAKSIAALINLAEASERLDYFRIQQEIHSLVLKQAEFASNHICKVRSNSNLNALIKFIDEKSRGLRE